MDYNNRILYLNEPKPFPSENINIIDKEYSYNDILIKTPFRVLKSDPIQIPGMVKSKPIKTLTYVLLEEIYNMSSISLSSSISVSISVSS